MRRLARSVALAAVECHTVAVLVVCAALLAPAAMGSSLQRLSGEQNDLRTELECWEQSRAAMHQMRAHGRSRSVPAADRKNLLVQTCNAFSGQSDSSTSTRSNLLADSWILPLRL